MLLQPLCNTEAALFSRVHLGLTLLYYYYRIKVACFHLKKHTRRTIEPWQPQQRSKHVIILDMKVKSHRLLIQNVSQRALHIVNLTSIEHLANLRASLLSLQLATDAFEPASTQHGDKLAQRFSGLGLVSTI